MLRNEIIRIPAVTIIAVSLALVASVFWNLASTAPVHACSCVQPGTPTEELEKSSAVFAGRVLSVNHSYDPDSVSVSPNDRTTIGLEVSTVWKGTVFEKIYITTPPTGGSCGFTFVEGQDYIVYGYDSSYDDGGYSVGICSRTEVLSLALEDLEELGIGDAPRTGAGGPVPEQPQDSGLLRVEGGFDFENDAEGWVVEYADLPVDHDQQTFELDHGHRPLPDGLEGSGIYLQGHNRSADLFMFMKRQIDGLRPNTTYSVFVSVELATNVPAGLAGIGGSPGESVYVKGGASTVEPKAVEGENRHLRMNIDKGNQARSGEAMVVVGNLANSEVQGSEYRIKTLDNQNMPVTVAIDNEGRVWLIVGTDSGFEGLSTIYYSYISYTLSAVEPPSTGGYIPPAWTLTSAAAVGGTLALTGLALMVGRTRRSADAK